PGDPVQVDCFTIGRLTGTKGRVWPYTAVDVASSFAWASLYVIPLNPAAQHTSERVRGVAQQLAEAGWQLKAVSTDKASEFRSGEFGPLPGRWESSTASSAPVDRRPMAPSSPSKPRLGSSLSDAPKAAGRHDCPTCPRRTPPRLPTSSLIGRSFAVLQPAAAGRRLPQRTIPASDVGA